MISKKRLYIAYGSNLNLTQMALRCPTARVAGAAALKDHELLFRGWKRGGVATVEPKPGSIVPVLVWDIKPKDELALDRYEGAPHLYSKRMMDVELDGEAVSAMIYVMAPGHDAGYPSRFYLNVIAEGYHSAGFDTAVLDAAVMRTDEIIQQDLERYYAMQENDLESWQDNLFDLKWGW